MNALLALHPCKAFGRSTSGIHARPRKRVRFCCSVKPSQLWWALLPIRTINEIFRTIPITKLASLVKGEVLSPPKNSGDYRRDCHSTPRPHQPSQNRTIPLAFRRVRVCVCLVGFASIAIVVVCGRCVTASSAISVAASCSD